MKNVIKYATLLIATALLSSGCLSWLFDDEDIYDTFQGDPAYWDKFVGSWAQDTIDSGDYRVFKFNSDGTDSLIYYTDNKIEKARSLRYKASDSQIVLRLGSPYHAARANYVFTGDDTLSLVNWTDSNDAMTLNRSDNASGEIGDNAIASSLRKATDTIISSLEKEATIAIVNISYSDSEISEFIAGELEFILVNNKFNVVDRSQLDKIRQEQNFQLSADVDDDSAVSIGKFAGANIVITGSISGSGDMRRLRLRALDTQTARVIGAASEFVQIETDAPKTTSEKTAIKVGDRGPAGGIVFYDKGEFSDGWRYLEAASAETEFSAQWSTVSDEYLPPLVNERFGDEIGFGKKNTDIMNRNADVYSAARLCARINAGGFNDWFLPSIEELDLCTRT